MFLKGSCVRAGCPRRYGGDRRATLLFVTAIRRQVVGGGAVEEGRVPGACSGRSDGTEAHLPTWRRPPGRGSGARDGGRGERLGEKGRRGEGVARRHA